ncbi:helix-turn-helix domain-containing protein [Galactobacter sp.]|uniref:helix-turn-helix domain-containing protein n=1 Tax=Galactobacter sp. TaxID=2676125 RepID=UPI0025BEE48A|nr:helix-turn-helix transcriptional regulator [Galactobacter sp.]
MNTGRDTQARPLLWREAVGAVLRRVRLRQRLRLVDVAERAGVSAQYLSEMERGMKDPSSEMLAATAGALGLGVGELARLASDVLVRSGTRVSQGQKLLVLDSSVSRAGAAATSVGTRVSAGTRDAFLLAA